METKAIQGPKGNWSRNQRSGRLRWRAAACGGRSNRFTQVH